MLLLARTVLAAPAPQALQPAAAPNASALIAPEVSLFVGGPPAGGAAAPAGGVGTAGVGIAEYAQCKQLMKKCNQYYGGSWEKFAECHDQCAKLAVAKAVAKAAQGMSDSVAYKQGFIQGREEGKEKGEEEGEIKGIKVTQDLFDCCEAAAGKIPGDPQKNIGTCMDDPEFAKKYGCAPKDDDPKTEERLRSAMADEAKTKRK